MTIQDLRYLRVSGKVPAFVWVIVGDRPKMQINGPDLVHISPNDDVKRMDLRPLVGLHVDVFECGDYEELFDAAAKAIDAAKPKTTGLASKKGFSGSSIEHEAVLRRTWEMLCKS